MCLLCLFLIRSLITCFRSDLGTEFWASPVHHILEKHKCRLFALRAPNKAAIVERFIQTLKGLIYKHLTATKKKEYISVLQALVKSYNDRDHSSIKMTPNDVTISNSRKVFNTLYPDYYDLLYKPPQLTGKQLPIGQLVRISHTRTPFTKGYRQGYSKEIYKIIDVRSSRPENYARYTLADSQDYEISGTYLMKDLKPVSSPKV